MRKKVNRRYYLFISHFAGIPPFCATCLVKMSQCDENICGHHCRGTKSASKGSLQINALQADLYGKSLLQKEGYRK
jgi:hypothetical protein